MKEFQLERTETFQGQNTPWEFKEVLFYDIATVPYDPVDGSSYIQLPKELADKHAIINVKNENDNECFKWAITSAVYKDKDPQRLNNQMKENANKLNWEGINFPTKVNDTHKFEKQNNYAINVFGYSKDKDVHTLIISKTYKSSMIDDPRVINLLLIWDGKTSHYCRVKNMSRLLSSSKNKHEHKREYCLRCMLSFKSRKSLIEPIELCTKNEPGKIKMPKKNNYVHFKNQRNKMRVPFVIYGDF